MFHSHFCDLISTIHAKRTSVTTGNYASLEIFCDQFHFLSFTFTHKDKDHFKKLTKFVFVQKDESLYKFHWLLALLHLMKESNNTITAVYMEVQFKKTFMELQTPWCETRFVFHSAVLHGRCAYKAHHFDSTARSALVAQINYKHIASWCSKNIDSPPQQQLPSGPSLRLSKIPKRPYRTGRRRHPISGSNVSTLLPHPISLHVLSMTLETSVALRATSQQPRQNSIKRHTSSA